MRWEAANVKKRPRSEDERHDGSKPKSSETVEAALARLTKAYSTAMACIGSLHRVAPLPENDETLQRVANAARTTLEHVILIDPLVAETYAPTWHHVVKQHASDERWAFVRNARPPPVSLTSSSHRSTVRELAYLSLVNYADLLVKACPARGQGDGILDRGVVFHVPRLSWKDESVEFTQRLALVALCDASELDGSDPTVWLKLACAARRLSVLSPLGSYDRLERHALERGRTALPPDVPPNRLVVKALTEYRQQQESVQVYPSKLYEQEATPPIVLDLPRYSWSILGRMLLRACREGSSYRSHYYYSSTSISAQQPFGSPSVVLKLSPMLVLPQESLGIICQYLDHASIWKFEATCRGLSASILQARASMERREANDPAGDKKGGLSNKTAMTLDAPGEASNQGAVTDKGSSVQPQERNQEQAARSHRTSKRVQSQLITSGKLAERKAKRSSVEFCFLAAVLGCSKDDETYKSMLKEELDWDNVLPGGLWIRSLSSCDPSSVKVGPKQVRDNDEFLARSGDASLTAFVVQWSAKNSGPMDVLSHYLGHVAMNVEEVFTVDPESTEVLASCIVECIDTLSQRSGFSRGLDHSWYDPETNPAIENVRDRIEVFAIDLLNAELRLRRCERVTFYNNEYNDDGTVVAALVPALLRETNRIERSFPELAEDREWFSLRTRLHWLAAGFYLWWSRVSHNITESRQAESRGLEHIDETIQSLKMPRKHPIQSVRTPHLDSPGRSEKHWKILSESSLSSFREERQASSVVSRTREIFIEKTELIGRRMDVAGDERDSNELTDDEKVSLCEIGSDLLSRYNVCYEEGNGERLQELIDDFLEMNGDALAEDLKGEKADVDTPQKQWDGVWDLIPSRLPQRDKLLTSACPSILSILSTCMHAREGNQLSLLLLLSRASLAGYDHIRFILHKTSGATFKDEAFSDDDDFSDSEDSFASNDEATKTGKDGDEIRVRLYSRVIQFFLDKILDIYEKNVTREDVSSYVSSQECLSVVHFSLAFSAELVRYLTNWAAFLDAPLDLRVYFSSQKLVQSLLKSVTDEGQKRTLESVFFHGLARILVEQRQTFPTFLRPSGGKRLGRAFRQKVCLNRAEYIGAVAGEMACMMSRARAELHSGQMIASYLVRFLNGSRVEKEHSMLPHKLTSLVSLCESALWFWDYMSFQMFDEGHAVRVNINTSVTSFDRPIIEVLYAPIASVVVGLCGSAITTRRVMCQETLTWKKRGDGLCLSELYDSDSSAVAWFLDAEDFENISADGAKRAKTEILRAICQAVHCVALVSCDVNAKSAVSHQPPNEDERQHGPLLPLVVCRVANHFADILLTEFGAEERLADKRKSLWATEYPFGARAIGALLDSTLYKAYRTLHGISLTGQIAQQVVAGMEHLVTSAPNDEMNQVKVVVPESTLAAAQLYRCIMRAYGTGRKLPPKAALECVASALPVMEESERSKVLRNFLFSGESEDFSHRDIISLVTRGSALPSVPDWVWAMDAVPDDTSLDAEIQDALLVRKGICHQLAQGPLPSLTGRSADSAKTTKQDGSTEERIITAHNEEELSKKFNAIVDDLCDGEPVNCRGWYDASQCLMMKAELIADRLGLSKGFSRAGGFQIPSQLVETEGRSTLAELIDEQEREYERNLQGWKPYLGKDLSVYIRHQWASFASLHACFAEVGDCGYRDVFDGSATEEYDFSAHIWKEIGGLYEKGDYAGWQQAWGGLFVGALRKMAVRCTFLALYLLRRQDLALTSEHFLACEISESLGVTYYSELMGSQMYGYPMHVMTDHRKRQMAKTALSCFQFAVDTLGVTRSDEDSEARQTWDLVFMRGKCYEKIASTYKREVFHDCKLPAADESEPARAYERHMKHALADYAASFKEAKGIHDEGGFTDIEAGGSSQGLTEVFYRLHASRLKCLFAAVSRREEEREDAELEALRLTTAHWYLSPPSDSENFNIRDRVWVVLADIVSALAQCRIEQPYFHRSVYRHAQALMWAPVFYDPVAGIADGSLGFVPATKSHLLRGLNSTTSCVNSAEVVISPLFEKKRAQICAVWVTNGGTAQSPFSLLNNSIRKYDSLRGKYISAYIDTLRLCKRKAKLEALLQSAASAVRDLPSFFQASALNKGGPPKLPHTKESLLPGRSLVSQGFLRNIKREANRAIVVILQDISLESTKGNEDTLKASYVCFLRLNCTVEELRRSRAWKFGQIPEVDALCQSYLARKDHKEVHTEASHWTGGGQKMAVLKAALEKCHELFPSLPLYGQRKATAKRSRKSNDSSVPSRAPIKHILLSPSPKHKEAEASVPFVVSVPEGLNAGDKFDTTVELEGGTMKKIRLTVPSGNPQKLKFSLTLSVTDDKSGSV